MRLARGKSTAAERLKAATTSAFAESTTSFSDSQTAVVALLI